MEDRFKIRAWDEETKSYFNPLDPSVNGLVLSIQGISGNFDMYGQDLNSDKFIMEQCTGLKDEYAQLIYEGDIVQSLETGKYYKVVYAYDLYSAMFVGESNQEEITCFGKTKVVGNIHENPELLEEQ